MRDDAVLQTLQAALAQYRAGNPLAAEELCRQVLSIEPDNVDALNVLGGCLYQIGNLDKAVEIYQTIAALQPELPEAHNNLGGCLQRNGRLADAIAAFKTAIKLKPDFPVAKSNLAAAYFEWGNALSAKGQTAEALEAFQQAVALKPDFIEALDKIGQCLQSLEKFDGAVAAYQTIIRLKPDTPGAFNNLGIALKSKGQLDEAIACFRQAIGLDPDLAEAHNNLGAALKEAGRLDEAIALYRQAMRLKPDDAKLHSTLVFTLHYHPGHDAKMIHEELRRWNQQHAEPLKKFIRPHTNDRNPDRRLRLGYVSPDFRDHVVGHNLLPLLREHDHGQLEVFCYANFLRADALTEEFRRYADAWRSIVGLSDLQAADLIRQDGIDILVDLALHTAMNRLGVFAYKPAPVQATFAGYPGSTGLETIDYRVTDPYLDPP